MKKKTYGFWNSQGCFLQEILATNERAARRQFFKIWDDSGNVTCREITPVEK